MTTLVDLKQEAKTLLYEQKMDELFVKLKSSLFTGSLKLDEIRAIELRSQELIGGNEKGKPLDSLKKEIDSIIEDLSDRDIASNYFTDSRDGRQYRQVELAGNTWMADNLNFAISEGSWTYKNKDKNGQKYGRLYTLEAAKAACPSGWRLPTDAEWRRLIQHFGGEIDGSSLAISKDSRKAYRALITGGESRFDAVLGGWHSSTKKVFSNIITDGCYLTGGEASIREIWCYTFNGLTGDLRRMKLAKDFGLSVRCVKE